MRFGSHIKIKFILTGVLCLLAGQLHAFPLKVRGVDTLRTAILIRDLRFGHDIVAENIDRPLIPASVMKSVTVASMLNLADIAERFSTPVVAEGRITDGVLEGNLVVKVCGDPTIESQFLPESQGFADSIAAGVKKLGIRKITGKVIIDESDFPDATTPPGWMAEDIPWYYGARLQGANFRDNRFRLRLPSKTTVPFVPDLKFNYINGKGGKIDRKDGSETFIVTGNRAINDIFAMPYPYKAMRHEIVSTLKDKGIEVGGGNVTPNGDELEVYVHESPEFGEIMQSLMFRSDNLMAEGMLRAIAPGGTRADAITEEMAVWTMAGISGHGLNIIDGSGLSRDNRLTARFLGDVYSYMTTDAFSNEYLNLFPRAGFDGTMKNFLVQSPLAGRVAMKTGSMKGVQCYGGYLFDADGYPTHIIVIMANNFRCNRAALKKDIERLLLEKFDVSLHKETSATSVADPQQTENED
ncbi:MAG: D-alanyl-D-alanine carboxypeptidase/D-alanyl-D-alanine-endopeptidase [Duncaniella sp.]|uniref:D-alanyl-D-alanine carboxypeptidase/D-alanyl-D-alanine endopeptidase n=1 Tax=Duncaniella sp. TaxID=2518496 RepID=UPI0023C7E24C|nr:D-alanyl-D-alanine carboxypeptidase/D-alanyl-D-alanine-endopeptidase [Duncaniella sp.]MDE6089199.1 D-alanyl-D-alanine carboxypeptidase/D-alanyl-D-alanine-endopeptidase [Duncaniella sp.]